MRHDKLPRNSVHHNVLITSAGRRGVFVGLFQAEVRQLFGNGKVFGGDLNPTMSSACHLADGSFQLPPVQSDDYASRIIDICLTNDIGLVVPTIDTELLPLAMNRPEFENHEISLVISDVELVQTCRDKRRSTTLFNRIGIETPERFERPSASDLPLFARPFDGSCSIGTRVLKHICDLTPELANDPKMLFTRYLDPQEYDEYTIDLYFDRSSRLQCLVPRLRLETRGGEVSKGRTERIPELSWLREAFCRLPGARGCITAQIFRHCRTGQVYGIEINPRFGGGFPLSYQAGANFPRWLLDEYLLNKNVEDFDEWESNLAMLRYDGQVFVRSTAA